MPMTANIQIVVMICLCTCGVGHAQTAASAGAAGADPRARIDWSDLIQRSAAEYDISLEIPGRPPLKLELRPVLRWANNTRNTVDGITFIWVGKGRPEVAACIYMWGPTAIRHNFQSLSRGRIVAERNGQPAWHPREPGVEFHRVPDAGPPSDSERVRLSQMKTLARRFTSVLVGWGPGNEVNEQLRLLPQPLYRYQSKDPDLLDGALFAFVEGTDPESLLLLKAVRMGESYQWQYAAARRTSGALETRYRNQRVWQVPSRGLTADPASPYVELEYPVDPADLVRPAEPP